MTNANHQTESEGTQYRLRVSVMDKIFDDQFVDLTSRPHRQQLPGLIMLYSDALHTVASTPRDGVETYEQKSARELAESQFNAYRSRVEQGYRTTKFSLTPDSLMYDAELHRINVRLHLGAVAGKTVISPPFFDPRTLNSDDHGSSMESIPVYYNIPHPTTPIRMAMAIHKMKLLMTERTRSFDELMVVNVGKNQPIPRAIIRRGHNRDEVSDHDEAITIHQTDERTEVDQPTDDQLKKTG
jgi:hypothetical protein